MYRDPKYLSMEEVGYFIKKIESFYSKELFKTGFILGSLVVIFILTLFFYRWFFILLVLLIIYSLIYINDSDKIKKNCIFTVKKIYREYESKFDSIVADLEKRGLLPGGQTIKKLGFHPIDKVENKGELQIEYEDLLNNIIDNYIHDLKLSKYLAIKNIFLKQ